MIVYFGGQHKRSQEIKKYVSKKLYHGKAGLLNGYCDAKANPPGFKIWVNSRQSNREMVQTFFHEMTHALLKMNFTGKPIRYRDLGRKHEERLCEWVGYLAKQQFADAMPKIFGRK